MEQNDFLRQLYSDYFFQILQYCKALLGGDETAALDCAHLVFDAAAQNLEKLKKHPNVIGWLMTTAKFRVKREYRRKGKQLALETSITDDSDRYLSELSYIENFDLAFEKDLDIDAEKAQLLGTLSDDEYKLYELYYVKHITQTEIARGLCKSPDAIRMRLARTRHKLEALIRKDST